MPATPSQIKITVQFYSFFKDLAGCVSFCEILPAGSSLGDLISSIAVRFPKLEPMQKSVLSAVGVEYQHRAYILRDGDEVSLFPPVQGG